MPAVTSQSSTEVTFFQSSDIELDVRVWLGRLQGLQARDDFDQVVDSSFSTTTHMASYEMYIEGEIWQYGAPVAVPVSASFKCFDHPSQCEWNEWISLPIRYRDLSLDAMLVLTVWYACDPHDALSLDPVPVASVAVPLFDGKSRLLHGFRTLPLLEDADALEAVEVARSAQQAPGAGGAGGAGAAGADPRLDSFEELQHRVQDSTLDVVPSVPLLEKLTMKTFSAMERSRRRVGALTLTAEFPHFGHRVVFADRSRARQSGVHARISATGASVVSGVSRTGTIAALQGAEGALGGGGDPAALTHAQAQARAAQMQARADAVRHLSAAATAPLFVDCDPETKFVNPIEDKMLSLRGTGDVKRLMRPDIHDRKKLEKLVRSKQQLHVQDCVLLYKYRYYLQQNPKALSKFLKSVKWNVEEQAKEALELLSRWAPLDVADAIELLSAEFSNEGVRAYGVKVLKTADDERFGNYLLELIHALRFEGQFPSPLSNFLLDRVMTKFEFATYFRWYVHVQALDVEHSGVYSRVMEGFHAALQRDPRAQRGEFASKLRDQELFVEQLLKIQAEVRACKAKKVAGKQEYLRQLLTEHSEFRKLQRLERPVHIPVAPNLEIVGIVAEKARLFRSAMVPMGLTFQLKDGGFYSVIFKSGDDLRQDQLVIQLFKLMDSLLKRVGLDMKLTPYPVLATSLQDGFVEFVPHSATLDSILEDHEGQIEKFFEKHHAKPGPRQRAIDTFIQSCAGYSVLTYILGVGDRHLENLLLTRDGHFFHIDFGYMFGRDPKPFPPPIKLTKEMVDFINKAGVKQYQLFESLCCTAFNTLRKSAPLIINLLSLMGEASSEESGEEWQRNVEKVSNNFRLDLSDEEAEQYFLGLINESVGALFARVSDHIHKWASYWR